MRAVAIALCLLACTARGQVQCATNSHVSFADADELSPTNITVSCWIFDGPFNAAYQCYFSKYLNAPENIEWIFERHNATNVRFGVSNNGLTTGRIYVYLYETLPQGRWCHVALTAGQGKANIYVDGQLKASSNFVGMLVNKNQPVRISAASYDATPIFQTDGSFYSDFRLYGRVLSAKEIRSICETSWALAYDYSRVIRTCVYSGDTGATLTNGLAIRNYGTGADGVYSNASTVAPGRIQTSKPFEEDNQ